MNLRLENRQAALSWLMVGVLFVLCTVLGVLQYQWIGEVSVAAQERMQRSLQASLGRLSQDFNTEIATSLRALVPASTPSDARMAEAVVEAQLDQWKKNNRGGQMFRRIALVTALDEDLSLKMLDLNKGLFAPAPWPEEWSRSKNQIESRISRRNRFGQGGGPGPPPVPGERPGGDGLVLEVPLWQPPADRQAPDATPRGRGFFNREIGWMLFEVNTDYARDVTLPQALQHHLGYEGSLEYQAEVVTKSNPPQVIYQSDPAAGRIAGKEDVSAGIFEMQFDQFFRRFGQQPNRDGGARDGARGGKRREGRGAPPPEMGRWTIYLRHREGSLDAVVAKARRWNLAVASGIMLLLIGAASALLSFSRRAQKLAELQMDFVAGVSHELRTPLTVIHTAAYSLRNKAAHNPAQVERYGEMIQQESGRLKDLVEQILQFASVKAGQVLQKSEPLSVENVIEETIEATKGVMQASHCKLESTVEPELPIIMGDRTALKHAFQNLLNNAAKYGKNGENWIGISAHQSNGQSKPVVEIRVSDHGPGIPHEEQKHIFEPFFRGRRAIDDQIHGTGLGLNLVKKIIEAHGGSIRVESEPEQGAAFIVRLPVAPV